MKTTVVIPMAGLGSRFLDAGWEMPKPFIPVNGKMMVERVLDSFSLVDENIDFVLIVRKSFFQQYHGKLDALKANRNIVFLSVDKVTQGAACTALVARDYFKDRRLIVADSDTFYDVNVMKEFFDFISREDVDQAVITFNSSQPCYSYINIKNGVEVAEKQVISSHAISGVYYFKNGTDFENGAINAMIYGDKDKGEFYMSKVFGNVAKDSSGRVEFFEIPLGSIYCTGTPSQLTDVLSRLEATCR